MKAGISLKKFQISFKIRPGMAYESDLYCIMETKSFKLLF